MRSPEQGEQPNVSRELNTIEQESGSYYLAARFTEELPARLAYSDAQVLIFNDSRADLSAYRLLLDQVSHVAVVGESPPEDLHQQLIGILSQGELAYLLPEVVKALYDRRSQMKKHGSWIEGHYQEGKPLNY